jgi:hypothetical protein
VESFEATIVDANGGGAFVRVPPEVVAALGGEGRIPVQATFDGLPYRGSVVSMGDGKVLGVLKQIREQLGKQLGDVVTVTVERDDAERSVEVPDDLRTALDRAGAAAAFAALSYTHRRGYVVWIDEAKKPGTRARRIQGTVERVQAAPRR